MAKYNQKKHYKQISLKQAERLFNNGYKVYAQPQNQFESYRLIHFHRSHSEKMKDVAHITDDIKKKYNYFKNCIDFINYTRECNFKSEIDLYVGIEEIKENIFDTTIEKLLEKYNSKIGIKLVRYMEKELSKIYKNQIIDINYQKARNQNWYVLYITLKEENGMMFGRFKYRLEIEPCDFNEDGVFNFGKWLGNEKIS